MCLNLIDSKFEHVGFEINIFFTTIAKLEIAAFYVVSVFCFVFFERITTISISAISAKPLPPSVHFPKFEKIS